MLFAVPLAHLAAMLWVLIRRRGMRPVLVVNLLVAVAALIFVVPQLPDEIAWFRSGVPTELFDYKNSIMASFELVTLIASVSAFWGALPAKIVAWVGFAGNFVLSILSALFFLNFTFKCCGYL